MHMSKTLFFLWVMLAGGCTGEKTSPSERFVLRDGQSPVGEIKHIESLGRDTLLVLDNGGKIYLFVRFELKKTVGKKGKGPGEYNAVSHFAVSGDTLYVLDRTLSKLIAYSISDEIWYDEITSPELAQFTAFVRIRGVFYFCSSLYTTATEPDRQLLYRFEKHDGATPLGVTIASLNISPLPTVVQGILPIRTQGSLLTACFPFASQMLVYDTDVDTFTTIRMPVELRSLSGSTKTTDMSTVLKFIASTEFIMGVYPRQKWIAFVTKRGQGEKTEWSIKYITASGDFIGQHKADSYVFHVDEERVLRYAVSQDTGTNFPHEVIDEKNQFVKRFL